MIWSLKSKRARLGLKKHKKARLKRALFFYTFQEWPQSWHTAIDLWIVFVLSFLNSLIISIGIVKNSHFKNSMMKPPHTQYTSEWCFLTCSDTICTWTFSLLHFGHLIITTSLISLYTRGEIKRIFVTKM